MTTYKDPDFNLMENVEHFAGFRDVVGFTPAGARERRAITLRYGLYGPIAPAPEPSADRVRAYIAARRYLAAHYHEAEAYWEARRRMQDERRELVEAQGWRYTKKRQREIERVDAMMDGLDSVIGEEIPRRVNEYAILCQNFRQSFYGCWYGSRSRRDWADNWARSYGRCIGVVAPADRATLTDPAVLAYTNPARPAQLALV